MSNEKRSVLYLNLIIEDAKEGIKAMIKEKIESSNLPKPLQKAAKKVGKKVATTMVTPSTVAQKMSEKLPLEVPEKMKKKGLTAFVDSVFVEGPYLVIELQIQKVDSVLMAEVKALEAEKDWSTLINWLQWLLTQLGMTNQQTLEEILLPGVVQKKMATIMEDILQEKFDEKKLVVDATVLPEDKQARFFYSKLREVRSSTAVKKDR